MTRGRLTFKKGFATVGLGAALAVSAISAQAGVRSHPLSARQLKRALLTVDELPTGYSKTKISKSSSATTDSCPKARDPLKGSTLAQAEADFSQGSFGPFLTESVAQQRSGTATNEMTTFRRLLAKCGTFKSKDKDGTVSVGSFKPESFPRLGDDTIALRLNIRSTGSGLNLAVQGDLVAVRTGDVITLVAQVGLVTAPPIATFEKVARRAVAKVQRARS